MPSRTATPAPAARLRGIGVRRGGHDVLADLDLDLPRGRLTALVGPNGAGKSTLVETLAGVLVPTSGTLEVDADVVAFVPQRAAVPDRLPVTVREVVAMGTWGPAARRLSRAESQRRVDDAVGALGLEDLVRRPLATLSGGERQRALLAQGLARRADLLLLDEPTTGLDAASSTHIRAAMTREAARGAAVVCVTHDPVVAEVADHVVRLDDGRVVDELDVTTGTSSG